MTYSDTIDISSFSGRPQRHHGRVHRTGVAEWEIGAERSAVRCGAVQTQQWQDNDNDTRGKGRAAAWGGDMAEQIVGSSGHAKLVRRKADNPSQGSRKNVVRVFSSLFCESSRHDILQVPKYTRWHATTGQTKH